MHGSDLVGMVLNIIDIMNYGSHDGSGFRHGDVYMDLMGSTIIGMSIRSGPLYRWEIIRFTTSKRKLETYSKVCSLAA